MSALVPIDAWTPDRLRAEVARRQWFHTVDLGGGVLTPGYDDTPAKLAHLHLPADLNGRSVLDIGAYDGFFAFEAERRGASRVMATDAWAWEWPGSDARSNFDWLREVLDSRVEDRVVSVEDLSPANVDGTYDVVLFLGVLYHAPDPLGYLRQVRSVTKHTLVLETLVDLLDLDVPAAAYYAGDALNGDASNHWGPNVAAVEGLLHDAGFTDVRNFGLWSENPMWALYLNGNRPRSPWRRLHDKLWRKPRSGRMVFHATVA